MAYFVRFLTPVNQKCLSLVLGYNYSLHHGGSMKIDKGRATYEIQETPDNLIITHRGRQNWGWALINLLPVILIVVILLFLITTDLPYAYPNKPETNLLTFLCLGLSMFIPSYVAYAALTWALGLMVDHEKITITADSLTIEKSGFGSIHLSREFLLEKSTSSIYVPGSPTQERPESIPFRRSSESDGKIPHLVPDQPHALVLPGAIQRGAYRHPYPDQGEISQHKRADG